MAYMDNSATSDFFIACLTEKNIDRIQEKCAQFGDADWEALLQCASLHKASGLLHAQIKKKGIAQLFPDAVLKKLRSTYLQNAAQNSALYSQLSIILAAFRKANIPVIVLKGAFLADAVYKNIAVRPMCDIDLLIKKEHLAAAAEELSVLGYKKQEFPNVEVVNSNDAIFVDFTKPNAFSLDFHLVIEHKNISFDMTGIWKRAVPVTIAGEEALGLSPHDLLCHLSFHAGFQHGFSAGILSLYDFYLAVQHYQNQIIWDEVWNLADRLKIGNCLYLTLFLLKDLFKLDIPGAMPESQSPREIPIVAGIAKHMVMSGRSNYEPLSESFAAMSGQKTLVGRVGVALRGLFLSRQTIARLYSTREQSPFIYFFYAVRLKDLLARYASVALRTALGKDAKVSAWVRQENERIRLKNWMENSKATR